MEMLIILIIIIYFPYSVEVARWLKRDCYALVFGFNKFISYIIMTTFTVVVVEDTFFSFNIQQQVKLIYNFYKHYITTCIRYKYFFVSG